MDFLSRGCDEGARMVRLLLNASLALAFVQETIEVLVKAGAVVEKIDPSRHWDVFWEDYRRMQEENGVPKEQQFNPKGKRALPGSSAL